MAEFVAFAILIIIGVGTLAGAWYYDEKVLPKEEK